MSSSKSINFFKNELNSLALEEGYTVLGEYINSSTKIQFIHNKCQDKFDMSPNKFKQGRRCPNCAGVKRRTPSEYKLFVETKTENEWSVEETFTNAITPINFIHKCGTFVNVSPNKFQFSPVRCTTCYKTFNYKSFFSMDREVDRSKKSIEDWKKEIFKKFQNRYTVISTTIKNSKDPIDIRCNMCNTISKKRVDALIHHDEECIFCKERSSVRDKFDDNDFLKEGYKLLDEKIDIKNNKQPLNLLHIKCGTIHRITYKDFFHKKHRCSNCKVSYNEQEIVEFIKTIYDGSIILHDRSMLKPNELDIYIPDKKLAIEYNGSYYHRVEKLGNNYHQKKTLDCNDKGIRLIHIFDSDWVHKKEFIKQKILIALNKDFRKKIYAKNTIVKIENNKERLRNFYNDNHIQGYTSNFIYSFSLYSKNKLVANILLAKPSKLSGTNSSKNNELEVIRYATAKEFCIVGGYNKLIMGLILSLPKEITRLYTYANLRYDSGSLYENSNWTLDSLTKPSYFYIKNNTYEEFHRTSFTREKLKKYYKDIYSDNLTEEEMSRKLNLNKIYDCGKLKFYLDI